MHGHVCQLFTPREGNESVARVDDAVIFLLLCRYAFGDVERPSGRRHSLPGHCVLLLLCRYTLIRQGVLFMGEEKERHKAYR